jgi:formate hydrogenlyase subunit 3/multisubunit Na+/H+ antiporter MnhD subunit
MWKRQDIKRLFAYSSIEHMGLATFAFGLGGPVGAFAGLLHMTAHSLIKSAIFFVVGHVVQTSGSQKIPDIRNIADRTPDLARALTVGGLAITGLPPFAIFASEFLILSAAVSRAPWTLPPLLLALLITFGVIFRRIQEMTGGFDFPVPRPLHQPILTFFPIWIHFGLALFIGLFFPETVGLLYHQALLSVGLTHGQ